MDIEGEYICPLHINSIYPDITVEMAEQFINRATMQSKEASIDRLVDQSLKSNRPNDGGYSKRFRKLNSKLISNAKKNNDKFSITLGNNMKGNLM